MDRSDFGFHRSALDFWFFGGKLYNINSTIARKRYIAAIKAHGAEFAMTNQKLGLL